LDWTVNHSVYVVYGMYVVVTACCFIGSVPNLILDRDRNVIPGRFDTLAQHLITDNVEIPDCLIPYPRRIASHYYCPIVSVPPVQLKYFRQWDMLTR